MPTLLSCIVTTPGSSTRGRIQQVDGDDVPSLVIVQDDTRFILIALGNGSVSSNSRE
jgi:hypothetical protein